MLAAHQDLFKRGAYRSAFSGVIDNISKTKIRGLIICLGPIN
jgi:hypothetical protein